MAVTPAQKLTQTVLKIARYMRTEWEMSQEETVGAVHVAVLELWNEPEIELEDPGNIGGLDDDDDE
jgi:hypothetical protein